MNSQVEKTLDDFNKKNGVRLGGVFEFNCFGKDGRLKWIEKAHNIVVDVGLDHILDASFHLLTQVTDWFIGLKGAGSPATGDTLASHGGWSEVTPFSGASRVTWLEGSASGQSITNATAASFAITSTATVEGAFVASIITGTGGVLMCAADFASAKAVENGDTLEVTYTISAADDGS